MNARTLSAVSGFALIVASCAAQDPRGKEATPTPTVTTTIPGEPVTTSPDSPSDGIAEATVDAPVNVVDDGVKFDPHEPLPTEELGVAPSVLGDFFATGDEPLPSILTSNLIASGGEALDPTTALSVFGVYAIPRPDGSSAAVMEIDTSATRIEGGTAMSSEVVYLVTDTASIDDLLARAADVDATTFDTIPDYEGTQGDPACGRIDIGSTATTVRTVEGCEYQRDEIANVRSVAFRRTNLLTNAPLELPETFATFPDELFDAGTIDSYRAQFGPPSGPIGTTIELEVRITLDAPLQAIDGWTPDGPNRWWSSDSSITVNAGIARWARNTTQEEL